MLKICWLAVAELLSILSSKSALYTVICIKRVLYFVLPKNKSVEQISKTKQKSVEQNSRK